MVRPLSEGEATGLPAAAAAVVDVAVGGGVGGVPGEKEAAADDSPAPLLGVHGKGADGRVDDGGLVVVAVAADQAAANAAAAASAQEGGRFPPI